MSTRNIIRPLQNAQPIRLGRLQSQPICRPSTQRLLPISCSLRSLSGFNNGRATINNPRFSYHPKHPLPQIKKRTFNDKGSTGKAEADLLVEELQELYEVAKDEFEIATESTDTSTIYAASDRESARDALNQLSTVYALYTARPGEVENETTQSLSETEELGDGPIIETNYNPAEIPQGVKDEVRRRVGQRIRELKNAVELLEQRAMED